MKKILAIALAMVLALGLSVATFAADAELNLEGFWDEYAGEEVPYYFDKELNDYDLGAFGFSGEELEEIEKECGITEATLLFPFTFAELGNFFTCTNHGDCGVRDYDFFKVEENSEFEAEPVINAKLTTNDKYAEFTVIPDPDGIGFVLAVTPIDLYIAKDIEIEGQFYVIRNLAKKAHKSPVVTFTVTLTNPYISDNDIEVVAGECDLYLRDDAYVVKTAQFAEAGENGLTLKLTTTVADQEFPVEIELPSVVGQNGVNFGLVYGYTDFVIDEDESSSQSSSSQSSSSAEPKKKRVVTEGTIPESVLELSETASWFGIGFGSKEAIVNGGKVTIGAGEEGEEGEAIIPLSFFADRFGFNELHEDDCDCKYCDFDTPTYLYCYVLDAEGNITYLGRFDAVPEGDEEESSQSSSASEPEELTVKFEWEVEAGETLGMLLISDEKFDTNAGEDEGDDETSEPEDDKDAPSTGSSEMISVAVAFAAVTVVAAGALSFKKSR